MQEKNRIYLGCVTDQEWSKALLEQYPNRHYKHQDQFKRKAEAEKGRDFPSLAGLQRIRQDKRVFGDELPR